MPVLPLAVQLVYDCDGIRVVETQVSLCSQESYEMFPSWPEGQPVPQYLTPQQAKPGTFHQVLDHIRQKLGLKAPPPPPSLTDQRVMQIADRVSIHQHDFLACFPSYNSQPLTQCCCNSVFAGMCGYHNTACNNSVCAYFLFGFEK